MFTHLVESILMEKLLKHFLPGYIMKSDVIHFLAFSFFVFIHLYGMCVAFYYQRKVFLIVLLPC